MAPCNVQALSLNDSIPHHPSNRMKRKASIVYRQFPVSQIEGRPVLSSDETKLMAVGEWHDVRFYKYSRQTRALRARKQLQ